MPDVTLLNDLPEEIILAIVEAGTLGVKDALMLRWVGRVPSQPHNTLD